MAFFCARVYEFLGLSTECLRISTPEFLSKKHFNFGQGLDFLKFRQGNRGENERNRGNKKENLRKNKEKRRKFDKKFRVRAPHFLLKILLFKKRV